MTKLFSSLVLALLLLSSCGSSKKTSETGTSLTDHEWRLTELMGAPIPVAMTSVSDVTLIFTKDGNRVSGFSGCNNYGGTYTLTNQTKISFSQMLSTMKACPSNMDLEAAFLKMLKEVDNYAIKDNVLSFSKAKMAPMAKFEPVKK